MTDLQLLFLVLAFLYGWECACWIGRGSMVFRTWLGLRFAARPPGSVLGNQRGGFVFAPPLPPLGIVFTAAQLPFSLSSQSLLACMPASFGMSGRPSQIGTFVTWNEIKSTSVRGKKVLLNGKFLIKSGSAAYAAWMAAFLREVTQAKPAERERLLSENLRQSFDTSQIESKWRKFKQQTVPVRVAANVLFVYLFVMAPLIIRFLGFGRTWLLLLIGLLLLTSTIASLFYRAHKEFFPEAEDDRFTHFLIFLLSPATAIRAFDALSRPLFEHCHPLAVAKVFCPESAFRSLAQRIWRDFRHPTGATGAELPVAARATEAYARQAIQTELEALLKKAGLKPDELLQAPAPTDETCLSYCPRCLSQFTTAQGVCADCGGLTLLPLAKP